MLFITKFCEYYIKWKQKIKNLLNDLSNEESKFATKKKGMLQTVKQEAINTMKTILSNLRQKVLNQVFVIIPMHLFQYRRYSSNCKQ